MESICFSNCAACCTRAFFVWVFVKGGRTSTFPEDILIGNPP